MCLGIICFGLVGLASFAARLLSLPMDSFAVCLDIVSLRAGLKFKVQGSLCFAVVGPWVCG